MTEEEGPVTWDENGKLVSLDEEQRERHRRAAAEIASLQPKLADHRNLTHKEFFYARCLELARGLDSLIKPGENYLETVFFTAVAVLGIALTKISVIWPLLLGVVAAIALFRLWVRLVVEKKKPL